MNYVFARGQCVGVFRDIVFIIRSIRPSRIGLLLLGTALGFSALVRLCSAVGIGAGYTATLCASAGVLIRPSAAFSTRICCAAVSA